MTYQLSEEYINRGFRISKFGEKSLALKHYERTIFVFGSNLDLRDDFISRLCDSYLNIHTAAVASGISL